ncbi:Eco29kI family restriction endonuclease [Corynebacterium felinum]|uniref:Eco29kI restriction endonuclease n=1 Tax=Corynebacterium felinum TaxID=131318 RepID=A0ABU2BA83_9CORY|nr:Eco29kI family restriction endonuclease [Corynebacterium felinum]MDF5821907.1 Eco29kI family restriction endonuclease [Corynebacterium felinum]MDR7355281.1 hypothetical protein [Corynebacterium felinum]WJY94634.1 Restriction endonuclease [Corynebacterium felinum]
MKAFDPLSYENLEKSIAIALDNQKIHRLDKLEQFEGAGVYALYYTGDFEPYRLLAESNRKLLGSWAIYIGKAEAENARKGSADYFNEAAGTKLFKRILDHRKSIAAATNLIVQDFWVRALPVMPTWIPLAEIISVRLHQPLWNKIVDGLGNHDPGSGRYKGQRPRWDTLHPGRKWATRLNDRNETASEISREAEKYLNEVGDPFSRVENEIAHSFE